MNPSPDLILSEDGDLEQNSQLILWQFSNCSLNLSVDNYEHQVASSVIIINYHAFLDWQGNQGQFFPAYLGEINNMWVQIRCPVETNECFLPVWSDCMMKKIQYFWHAKVVIRWKPTIYCISFLSGYISNLDPCSLVIGTVWIDNSTILLKLLCKFWPALCQRGLLVNEK